MHFCLVPETQRRVPPLHCETERGCWTADGCLRPPKAWKCDGRPAVEGGETGGDSRNSTCSPRDSVPSAAVPQICRSGTKRPEGASK